jgi:stearoyl-CoA desaturase (delta-9 desaturase)
MNGTATVDKSPGLKFARVGIFLGFHVATAILVVFAGLPTWEIVALMIGMYYVRMFAITGGMHRYFSHRTFKTSRVFQNVLALLSILSLQKGILWWAAHHRHHHRNSDQPGDVHSPVQRGFWWAHMGWIISADHDETRWDQIKDFAKYPELRFLNSNLVMIGLFALMCAAFNFGWSFQALVYGCFVSTVLLWHGTFTINSLSHLFGKRVYATSDDSRNSFLLSLITMGEGWHNNHHYYQSTARQGFLWWQFDPTYYILWCLEKVGVIWDLRKVPDEVVAGNLGGRNWLVENQVGATPPAAKPELVPEKVAA